MPTIATAPVLLTPVSDEDLGQLEIALPNVSVISYAGPGGTGGLPASLSPVVKRLNTRVNWFALTDLPEQDFSPTGSSGFTFHNPNVPQWLIKAHRRFCQNYLAPLLHGFPEKSVFDQEDWKSFKQLNELIASHCLIANSESYPSLFWLHDYQLALAAPIIGSEAGIILCQFWHVPFPEASIITSYPCGKELVDALLLNRLVGFHTKKYAQNFIDAVEQFYPEAVLDREAMTIVQKGKTCRLAIMPLGIDVPYWQDLATKARPKAEALSMQLGLAHQFILGVDRLEPNKGILERLNGLTEFLTNHKEFHQRFHYVQIAQEVKEASPELIEYKEAVERKIENINAQFKQDNWSPIVYLRENLSQQELAAWYQAAAVLSVNSTADGLNLIAKEFVASRLDEQGALVLSQNAGVATELARGALLVDPHSAEAVGSAFHQALSFDSEEKRRRMMSMRHVIGWNQLHNWAVGFLRKAILD